MDFHDRPRHREGRGPVAAAGRPGAALRRPWRLARRRGPAEQLSSEQRLKTVRLWADALAPSGSTTATTLVVDDLHWADETTCDFLVYLASTAARRGLSLVLTLRNDEAPRVGRVHQAVAELSRLPGARMSSWTAWIWPRHGAGRGADRRRRRRRRGLVRAVAGQPLSARRAGQGPRLAAGEGRAARPGPRPRAGRRRAGRAGRDLRALGARPAAHRASELPAAATATPCGRRSTSASSSSTVPTTRSGTA